MSRPATSARTLVALLATAGLVGLLALPVVAADPSGGATAAASASVAPDATPKPGKSPKPGKAKEKAPAAPVTMTGTVGTRTDAEGDLEYTLTNGATVVVLDAGPSWFHGDDHPLKEDVGQRVTVIGEQRAGSAEIEVETVDGVALREPGKPPWAGGWKAVGSAHPGWTQEKQDRWEARQAAKAERNAAKAQAHGVECWPPGHCKDKAKEPAPTPTPGAD
jgi:hypothetical protein